MNNIDKSNPNVPENDQNWIEIVVITYGHYLHINIFWLTKRLLQSTILYAF